MASGNHPSIITQVSKDSEHAKIAAEIHLHSTNEAQVQHQPQPQLNENGSGEAVFSPPSKATGNPAVSQGDNSGHDALHETSPDGKSSTSKTKSVFCCFKLRKRNNKKQQGSERYKYNHAAKHKTSNGGSQSDCGVQHDDHGWGHDGHQHGHAGHLNGEILAGVAVPHLLPALPDGQESRRCVVVDLDETLVHSSFKPVDKPDFIVDVEIDGIVHQVYVLKRPFADEFLIRLGQLFECVLFTASLSKYADPVTNWLDSRHEKVFAARLFREACVLHKGNYVKDLSRLGRPLNSVVIVDNSPASYCFHPQNAVPVKSWFDDMSDRELLELLPLFEQLATCSDIYAVLAQHHAERQAQHAQEMALLRSLPLALAAAQALPPPNTPLPPYQLVAATSPLPHYVALHADVEPEALPEPPSDASVHLADTSTSLNSSLGNDSLVESNSHNGNIEQALSSCVLSSLAAGRNSPIGDLEVTQAAITAGADVSGPLPQSDEDRSLFSPTPLSPLFIAPPSPKLGASTHAHSASASHTLWSANASDGDDTASGSRQNSSTRQRRNSAGSHKWRRHDSQKQRTPRPLSTHPDLGTTSAASTTTSTTHSSFNNNGKQASVVAKVNVAADVTSKDHAI